MARASDPGDIANMEDNVGDDLRETFRAEPPTWHLGSGNAAAAAKLYPMEDKNQSRVLLSRPVNSDDHVQGSDAAAVTLLMYGAYECPHCVEGNQIVKQVQSVYGEDLRFVFRHFPRPNVHPHAEAAAEVAEAAGEQNRFWEMHDKLFDNYNRLDGDHLIGYARELDLDMQRFDRIITERVFAKRVREDLISGMESGVTGTPTYFINGVKHTADGRFETLVEAIQGSLVQCDISSAGQGGPKC